jgi:hypothetical protein
MFYITIEERMKQYIFGLGGIVLVCVLLYCLYNAHKEEFLASTYISYQNYNKLEIIKLLEENEQNITNILKNKNLEVLDLTKLDVSDPKDQDYYKNLSGSDKVLANKYIDLSDPDKNNVKFIKKYGIKSEDSFFLWKIKQDGELTSENNAFGNLISTLRSASLFEDKIKLPKTFKQIPLGKTHKQQFEAPEDYAISKYEPKQFIKNKLNLLKTQGKLEVKYSENKLLASIKDPNIISLQNYVRDLCVGLCHYLAYLFLFGLKEKLNDTASPKLDDTKLQKIGEYYNDYYNLYSDLGNNILKNNPDPDNHIPDEEQKILHILLFSNNTQILENINNYNYETQIQKFCKNTFVSDIIDTCEDVTITTSGSSTSSAGSSTSSAGTGGGSGGTFSFNNHTHNTPHVHDKVVSSNNTANRLEKLFQKADDYGLIDYKTFVGDLFDKMDDLEDRIKAIEAEDELYKFESDFLPYDIQTNTEEYYDDMELLAKAELARQL